MNIKPTQEVTFLRVDQILKGTVTRVCRTHIHVWVSVHGKLTEFHITPDQVLEEDKLWTKSTKQLKKH